MTTYKNILKSTPARIAIEAQLLAEEKWIIDSLKALKSHRNCLQIERLHLESQKLRLKNGFEGLKPEYSDGSQTPATVSEPDQAQIRTSGTCMQHRSTGRILHEEELCNDEELDLSVTKPIFSASSYIDTEDEEEDEMDMNEDVEIDMNMLVSGAHREDYDLFAAWIANVRARNNRNF